MDTGAPLILLPPVCGEMSDKEVQCFCLEKKHPFIFEDLLVLEICVLHVDFVSVLTSALKKPGFGLLLTAVLLIFYPSSHVLPSPTPALGVTELMESSVYPRTKEPTVL